MNCFRLGVIAASIVLLAATATNGVPVRIAIDTKGCAASHPNEPVYLSFWRANHFPGFGTETARRTTLSRRLHITLLPGYYRVMLWSGDCWEEAQWFSLLAGRPRSVVLHFKSFRAAPGTDYDVYYTPRGSVAGLVPLDTQRVQIISRDRKTVATATLQDGAYYDDVVAPGHYLIRVVRGNAVSDKRVFVMADRLTQVDFSQTSVRAEKGGRQ